MTAPTERDIDLILADLEQYGIKVGAQLVGQWTPEHQAEAKQAIEKYYRQKFERLIGNDEELVPQKQMANPIANTVRIVRNEFRANLKDKLRGDK